MFGRRRPHRQEASRFTAAAELYERFRRSEPPRFPSLEDVAMEAIVTGVCERIDPRASLGVPLPVPPPDTARIGLLTEAIALLDPVVDRPVKDPRTARLAARCRHEQFRETGQVEPLRRAVGLWEWATAADDVDSPVLHELAVALLDLATFEDRGSNLVRAGQVIVRIAPTGAVPERAEATYWSTRSLAMGALFEHTGEDEFREDAIYQAAHAVTSAGQPAEPGSAYALGEAFRISYEATGSLEDLERAVIAFREAVGLDLRAEHLLGLARALRLLYPTNGDEQMLRDAVDTARRALAAARPSDPRRHLYLENAAHARLLSHTASAGPGVVDVAVALQRLAIGSMPEAYPRRTAAIGLLGDLWLARYEKARAPADLDGGLEAALVAMRLSQGQADHHRHLARYGRLARHVFELSDGDAAHLYRGLRATAKALDTEGLPEVARGSYLLQMAKLSVEYHKHDPTAEIDPDIRKLLYRCISIDGQEPQVLAEAGRLWADLAIAAESWSEAGAACFTALRAMWRMAGLDVSRESQESTLARFSGLASLGAACMVREGDRMTALAILEVGRCVMMTQDLDLYGEVQALQRSDPDLSRRLAEQLKQRDEAAALLDRRPFAGVGGPTADGRTSDIRRVAARNLQILASEVRKVGGHEDFMTVPSDDRLLAAARHGPIVTINVSPLRSDALVMQPAGVTVIPLPAVTPAAVDDLTRIFLAAAEDPDPSAGETMLDCLEWLWDNLAEPVLKVAAPRGDGPLPRMWWCPTGQLSFLPLHAAGHHREDGGRTVLARAVSSYTPNIMALERIRSRQSTSPPDANLLAVAVSRTASGEEELPGARSEASAIAEVHAGTTTVEDAEVTRTSLLRALPGYRRVHFMCHAVSEPDRPSLSRLMLYDTHDAMTVRDIARLDLSGVELAYLSACDAATPSAVITDEAVHIAGAFLIAGYPDVVGTLWPMLDVVGAQLASTFYRRLTEGTGPAHALHDTVTELYRSARDSPVLWANLVHFGG
jgi:hypothetical protein